MAKINLSVQNLKPDVFYKAYLICGAENDSKGVAVGAVNVDEKGKGELKTEFYPSKLRDVIEMNEVNVVTVIAVGQSEVGVISPLVGYIGEVVRWKTHFADVSTESGENGANRMQPARQLKKAPHEVEEKPLSDDGAEQEAAAVESVSEQAVGVKPDEGAGQELTPIESVSEQAVGVKPDEGVGQELTPNESVSEQAVDRKPNEGAGQELTPDESVSEQAADNKPDEGAGQKLTSIEFVKSESAESDLSDRHEVPRLRAHGAEKGFRAAGADDSLFNAIKYQTSEKPNESIHETFKNMARKFNEELEELEYLTFFPDDDEKDVVVAHGVNNNDFKIKDEIEYLFDNCEELKPFDGENEGIIWIKISVKELAILPIDCWSEISRPFIWLAYRRFNHLILGKSEKSGRKTYFIGAPDRYSAARAERNAPTGFERFRFCDDEKTSFGDTGYWLKKL
jgi:hypothetical protein